jgi:flagellar basal-body rod protein FlgG
MFGVLKLGQSGMNAYQGKMNGLSQDIANSTTAGYKKVNIDYDELANRALMDHEVKVSDNETNAAVGLGSRATINGRDFSQGILMNTGVVTDFAIEGSGLFGVTDDAGNIYYTRSGAFSVDSDGTLVDKLGNKVVIDFEAGMENTNMRETVFSTTGEIVIQNEDGSTSLVGYLPLFGANENQLVSIGDNLYTAPAGVTVYKSTEDTDYEFGKTIQYCLENSNADLAESLTDMIVTQQGYNMNAKSIQTIDDSLYLINNLDK